MRRWNGWGDDQIDFHVAPSAQAWIAGQIGAATPPAPVTLAEVIKNVPESRLPVHTMISADAEDRVRHALGQSFPDWVAMRSGRIPAFPDGITYPETEADIQALYQYAKQHGAKLIPYGGGTSVVGHINPPRSEAPILTVDLSRFNKLHHIDIKTRLATLGAGLKGPDVERLLKGHGFTLGHFPQSWELSTLGGWVVTRSSGQQSLHYGRIENLFAGGRMIMPKGTLDLLPLPASAAGSDLRQIVLGSEGRMGIVTEATVRIAPLPEAEYFHGFFFRTWEDGVNAVRSMAQARLPLSMLRLSNAAETEANLNLAGHESAVKMLHDVTAKLGYERGKKCLLLMGCTGKSSTVARARKEAGSIVRQHGGQYASTYFGREWAKRRFTTPYIRNNMWDLGYAIDTLETSVTWDKIIPAASAIIRGIEEAMQGTGEKVHAFAHLSHVYETGASIYVTYLFRVLPDPEQMLTHWFKMKDAASRAIIQHNGTISHQHGVGLDHMPYLEAEKGAMGMAMLRNILHHADPDGMLNPGKLIE